MNIKKIMLVLVLVLLSACTAETDSSVETVTGENNSYVITEGKNCRYMPFIFSAWRYNFHDRLINAIRYKNLSLGIITEKQAWEEIDSFHVNHVNNAGVEVLKYLDSEKSFFLIDEANEIAFNIQNYFKGLLTRSENNCSDWLYPIKAILVKSRERNLRIVKETLRDYIPDSTVRVEKNPENWPSSQEEQKNRVRSLIHFTMAMNSIDKSETQLNEMKDSILFNHENYLEAAKNINELGLLEMAQAAYGRGLSRNDFFVVTKKTSIDGALGNDLVGIGLSLTIGNDKEMLILEVIPGGPAIGSGKIQPNDVILAVGQGENGVMKSVKQKSIGTVVEEIKGKKGTTVRLQIQRSGMDSFIVSLVRKKIDIQRSRIKFYSVTTEKNKDLKIAHVIFPQFSVADEAGSSGNGFEDIKARIEEIKQEEANGFILDLRSNTGGGMITALGIAGLFLKKGKLLSQHGFEGTPTILENGVYFDNMPKIIERVDSVDDPSAQYNGPVIVLINSLSASASEILSGILKDYGRALIVGTDRTFGKGSMQIPEFFDKKIEGELSIMNSFIKMTTGIFYTPSGNSPNVRGVKSDISFPSLLDRAQVRADIKLRFKREKKYSIDEFRSSPHEVGARTMWKPITAEEVSELQYRSKERVVNNSGFQEIQKQINALDEYYERTKVSESVGSLKEELYRRKNVPYSVGLLQRTSHLEETINIMLDLIEIQNQEKEAINAENK